METIPCPAVLSWTNSASTPELCPPARVDGPARPLCCSLHPLQHQGQEPAGTSRMCLHSHWSRGTPTLLMGIWLTKATNQSKHPVIKSKKHQIPFYRELSKNVHVAWTRAFLKQAKVCLFGQLFKFLATLLHTKWVTPPVAVLSHFTALLSWQSTNSPLKQNRLDATYCL